MVPGSTYRERLPPAALAEHVLCVWSQVIGAGQEVCRHRVLPDGCADLVWIGAAPPVVAGPARGPVVVALAPRAIVVGLRLRPGAVPGVLGVPASELLDRDTPLAEIWGRGAAGLAARVAEQASVAGRQMAAEAALLQRLRTARPPDRTILAASRWLARHPAGRIATLARVLEVGERRLHRRFTAAVGYGPKTFQRVMRLQRLLALARRQPRSRARSGATLAAAAGYADQAHLARELRALTGQTAGALLPGAACTLELSELFKTAPGAAP
jgi:AraC-like DNA-binding protein